MQVWSLGSSCISTVCNECSFSDGELFWIKIKFDCPAFFFILLLNDVILQLREKIIQVCIQGGCSIGMIYDNKPPVSICANADMSNISLGGCVNRKVFFGICPDIKPHMPMIR